MNIIELNNNIITHDTVKFSGGEVQLKITKNLINEHNKIKAHITSSDGVMLLAQLAYVLDGKKNDLLLPYVPYSRYDHTESTDDALSAKVFCKMINAMNFNKVVTHDNHSDVVTALLDRCINVPQHELILKLFEYNSIARPTETLQSYDAIVAPDSSASKKAFKLARILKKPLIVCDKHRDFDTRQIIDFTVPEQELIGKNYSNVLMVDDICDGGRTFVPVAEKLLDYVDNVDLYVTHGLFSRGTSELHSSIRRIYTSHQWPTMNPDNFMKQFII